MQLVTIDLWARWVFDDNTPHVADVTTFPWGVESHEITGVSSKRSAYYSACSGGKIITTRWYVEHEKHLWCSSADAAEESEAVCVYFAKNLPVRHPYRWYHRLVSHCVHGPTYNYEGPRQHTRQLWHNERLQLSAIAQQWSSTLHCQVVATIITRNIPLLLRVIWFSIPPTVTPIIGRWTWSRQRAQRLQCVLYVRTKAREAVTSVDRWEWE